MNSNGCTVPRPASRRVLLLALAIAVGFGAEGIGAQEYTLGNSVVGSGGGTIAGSGHQIVGTVGQYATGTVSDDTHSLHSGIGHDVYGVLWTEVGAEVEQVSDVPKQYRLEQNYPNPFNPSTTIRFALRNRSHVDLSLYNILGQPVKTLVKGDLSPGEYDVTLDAQSLPTGVYFYRLMAGTFVESRKLVILK